MHARRNQDRIVGISIRLLDARGLLTAFLGDDLVALPGVELDAGLDDVEGEEGGGEDEGDGEGAGDGEDLAEAEGGCCVCHCW